MKKMIFSYKGKAKDLLNEIKKERNKMTLEEEMEMKREKIYDDDYTEYLENYDD